MTIVTYIARAGPDRRARTELDRDGSKRCEELELKLVELKLVELELELELVELELKLELEPARNCARR